MKYHHLNTRTLLAFACLGASGWAGAQAIVGEATMVIGAATAIDAAGVSRTIERGAAIRVGDRIETQAGGHVLLRFVDGGRLSLRPASRLQIESYSHTAEQPQLGAIKFRLDEGVVRSITGSWGEAARERFRLNTPVAAIGVKGTDFIVRSHAGTTAAAVYTGAIMVTPLAGTCSASVGPCLNGSEKTLTADMRGQMLELARSQSTPTLVTTAETVIRPPSSTAVVAQADVAPAAGKSREGVVADNANAKNLSNEALGVTLAAYVPPVVSEPELPPVVLPPQVNQLAWVRYSWINRPDSDTFSRSLEQALEAGLEKVASNSGYALYRPPSTATGTGTAPSLASQNMAEPVVNFRLAEATAHLWRGAFLPAENVNVHNGALTVDFGRSTFATRLDVSNSRIGAENITASGAVLPTGALRANVSNAAIAGGLSSDGREAGYAFEKALGNNGVLRGITLWGR